MSSRVFKHLKKSFPHTLKIYGVIDRKLVNSIKKHNFAGFQIKIYRFKPPVLNITNRSSNSNPGFLISKIQLFRALILTFSKQPKTLLCKKWVCISIIVDYSKNEGVYRNLNLEDNFLENKIYFSRSVARFGYPIKKLDLSHDYDLQRNLNNYEIVLGWARLFTNNYKIPFKNKHEFNRFIESDYSKKEFKTLMSKSFFGSIYSQGDIAIEKVHVNQIEISGSIRRTSGTSLRPITQNGSWNYQILSNVKVFHGTLVLDDSSFYLLDPNRKSNWGSSTNLIPGLIFQDIDNNWKTPRAIIKEDDIREAILVGGVKNMMHCVLEDLPRIYLSDIISLPKSVPLIVSDSLSEQIYGLIKKVSGRNCILLGHLTECTVEKLHFFEFDSPLPLVMQGEINYADGLISKTTSQYISNLIRKDHEIIKERGKRILILREKGLFRPLINSKKIENYLVKNHNFLAVYLADKTHDEVLEIFYNAEIVVGEYGAGLANCIYMEPGSTLIEIRGPSELHSKEYEILAKSLKINHLVVGGMNRYLSRFGLARGPYKIRPRRLFNLIDTHYRQN